MASGEAVDGDGAASGSASGSGTAAAAASSGVGTEGEGGSEDGDGTATDFFLRGARRFRFGGGAMHASTAFSRSGPDKSRTGEGCFLRKASKRFPKPFAPFQLFVTKLTVRPGSRLAIALLPFPRWRSDRIIRASSGVIGACEMFGSNCLVQRWLHCLGSLLGTVAATVSQ